MTDAPPNENFWLLFKVSSKQRLEQMQKGLIYMNSLDYFSSLKGESNMDVRGDPHENIHGVLRAGPNDNGHSELWIKIGDKEFNLGKKVCLSALSIKTQKI